MVVFLLEKRQFYQIIDHFRPKPWGGHFFTAQYDDISVGVISIRQLLSMKKKDRLFRNKKTDYLETIDPSTKETDYLETKRPII